MTRPGKGWPNSLPPGPLNVHGSDVNVTSYCARGQNRRPVTGLPRRSHGGRRCLENRGPRIWSRAGQAPLAQFARSLRPPGPESDWVSPAQALGLHLDLRLPSPRAPAVPDVRVGIVRLLGPQGSSSCPGDWSGPRQARPWTRPWQRAWDRGPAGPRRLIATPTPSAGPSGVWGERPL